MLGAIAGDVIGSVYEWDRIKSTDFPLFDPESHFTDDTVLTIAVARCLLDGDDYVAAFHDAHSLYPDAGWGGMFNQWAWLKQTKPYNSLGNGSAMRVSPIGFAFDSLEETLNEAARSAAVTHNHPEGIKGAQATAAAMWLARHGHDQHSIRRELESRFAYNLSRSLNDIRPTYSFDETCPGSVPEAIIAFLESTSYEDAIRKAISLGGDADTQACIAGGIAQAFYSGLPAQSDKQP
jgi:ADP-ribosylglycohydrolase